MQAYCNLALQLIMEDKLSEATELLQKALLIDKDNICARSNMVKLRLLSNSKGTGKNKS
jgi:lipopolysaccharide biosynthesis regulator YciM